jgi:hypothetical protein
MTYMVLRRFGEALEMFAHISLSTFRITGLMAACHARMGDTVQARKLADECLSLRPGFSIRQFMSKEPFRNPADAEYFAESLRLAGLPE